MSPPIPNKTELADRLTMPSLHEAKAQAEAAARDPEPVKADDPKMAETYRFDVDIEGGGGRRYKGTFVNKILNLGQKKLMGVMRAKQCAGAPVESFTVETFEQITWSCWLTLSLVEMPKWFEDVDSILDPIVFEKIAKEVDAHERTFLRPLKPSQPGA